MSELPQGWAATGFLDVLSIEGGGQPPKSNFVYEPKVGYVQLLQIRDFGSRPVPTYIPDTGNLKKCVASDVLIARYGASIGRILTGLEGAYNVAMAKVVIPDGIDRSYVRHLLQSELFQAPLRLVSRSAQNGFNKEDLAGFEVVIAPEREQTRIANQLDTLLARIQACNDRFDAIPDLLKRFRQTVLDAALNGAFLDGAAAAESKQPKVAISTIASVGTGSTPLRSNSQFFASSGTPWITSSATSAAVVTSANEFVTPAAISAHRLKVFPKGTLLVAMYGEGKTRGQVAELGIEATINQACAAVVVNESKAIRAYVKLALQANYLNMRQLAEGGNQPNLNLSKVKEFEIPLPLLAEQAEIVRRVEALFALADRIEARCTAARTQAQRLSPLVLAKAFRGELVAQDPTDEPASELLARLASVTPSRKNKQKQSPLLTQKA